MSESCGSDDMVYLLSPFFLRIPIATDFAVQCTWHIRVSNWRVNLFTRVLAFDPFTSTLELHSTPQSIQPRETDTCATWIETVFSSLRISIISNRFAEFDSLHVTAYFHTNFVHYTIVRICVSHLAITICGGTESERRWKRPFRLITHSIKFNEFE